MITLDAMGLEDADELTGFMQACLKEYSGCSYRGSHREDSTLTNAEVVTYLAEGGRDLRTMSAAMAALLGDAWKQQIDNAAALMVKKRTGEFKKAWAKKKDWQRAKVAAARAWRACGKAYLEEMHRRLEGQLAADQSGNEAAADKVSDEYAAMREREYGVPASRVYVATAQLQADLTPGLEGNIKIEKGENAADRAVFRKNIRKFARALKKETQSQLGLGRGKFIK